MEDRVEMTEKTSSKHPQIEYMIIQSRHHKGARSTRICGGLVLTPSEDRMLALAICPELAQK